MERRATMARSPSSALPKMNACVALLLCSVLGSALAYYPARQAPYNEVPFDNSVIVNPNYISGQESQRLFWGNNGSNQVGGTGLWASLTNKFPWLGNMFGRMELAPEYGVPQVTQLSTQYGPPARFQQPQQQYYPAPQFYQAPQQTYRAPQIYQLPLNYPVQQTYQAPQTYQPAQYYQQPLQFGQRFQPGGRDVGFTDDAIIVTPPQVPITPIQPVRPVQPAPPPQVVPAPAPGGYNYDKPQNRLELPHK